MTGRSTRHPAAPAVVARARRSGPLPVSALGLSPARPGRGPGPPWVAATLDRLWAELGRPDPLVVVEAGADGGRLAADVLATAPACGPTLRWLLVDDDPAARRRPQPGLALEDLAEVLGPVLVGDDPDDGPVPLARIGPLVASAPELPSGLPAGVVLALGWLGRLPGDLFEWSGDRWWEVRLAAGSGDDGLTEVLVDAGRVPEGAAPLDGERRHDPAAARRWLARARRTAHRGAVVAVEGAPAGTGPTGTVGSVAIRSGPAGAAGLLGLLGLLGPRATVLDVGPGLVAAEWSMG